MSGISSSGQQAAGRTALTPPQQHVLATLTETKKMQQFGNECFESFDDKKPIKNAFKNTPPGFGPGTLFFLAEHCFFYRDAVWPLLVFYHVLTQYFCDFLPAGDAW